MIKQRELTESEMRALQLCRYFDDAADQRLHTVSLHVTEEGAEVILKLDKLGEKFRIVNLTFDESRGKFRVTWSLAEFQNYMLYIMSLVGMTLMMDGSIRTKDGLTVTTEYLQ